MNKKLVLGLSVLVLLVLTLNVLGALENTQVSACTAAGCSVANYNDNSTTIGASLGKGATDVVDFAATSDLGAADTINSVDFSFRWTNVVNLDGNWNFDFRSQDAVTSYCTISIPQTDIANDEYEVRSIHTGCTTGTGVSTKTRLDDLEVLITNADAGGPQTGAILYVNITIDYTPSDTTNPMMNASLNNSAPKINEVVNMTANVTDETALDTCQFFMNGTPDGSFIILNKTVTGTNDQCSQNFTIALPRTNVINFTVIVNDTTNNINQSEQTITVANTPATEATIVYPTNDFKTNSQPLDLNVTFAADPDGDVMNISYYIDGALNQSSFTNTTFNASDGIYILNVSLHDNVSGAATSANVTVNFTVDTTLPIINTTLNKSLTDIKGLDIINITANATDETELSFGQILVNISGYVRIFNFSLSGSATSSFSQNITVNTSKNEVINFTARVNDSANNFKTNDTIITVQETKGTVTVGVNDSSPKINEVVNVSSNATDADGLSFCLIKTNQTGSFTNNTFELSGTSGFCSDPITISAARGSVVNFTIEINDSVGDVVYENSTKVTVANTPATAATIVFPTSDLKSNSQPLDLNVTFAADPDGDVMNISYYIDGALNQSSFTNTTFNASDGVYILNVSLHDNVSGAATSANVTINFTVDTTKPNTTLNAPVDAYNASIANITFNFTATDNINTALNCSIYINGTLNQTNSSTINGTGTLFAVYDIAEGFYEWNVTCLDATLNSNTSETRNFTVDLTPPAANKISFWPNSTGDVDPDVLLNFTVNVTDNGAGVKEVMLQYKQSGAGSFTNSTMQYNSGTGLYNASFTPDIAETWNYRIYVLDYAENNDSSDMQSISVGYERTWVRTPGTFDTFSCIASTTCVAGNITINNTGDFTLNFDLSSNFTGTSYNLSEPFDLAAGEYEVAEVSLTAGATESEENVRITIDATTANADPDVETTNVTFVSSSGGPVFDLTIVSDIIEVNRSAGEPFNLTAKLKNIGNETAGVTYINWTLPENWLNISGTNLTKNVSNVSVQEVVYHNITVNLTSSATTGTKTINLAAASSDGASDNTTTRIVVTETSTTTVVTETTTVSGGGGGAGGGGGGGGGSLVLVPVKPEEIEISQTVDLVRGKDNTFTIEVENTFEDGVLKDLTLEVEGFLSQYLTITPKIISSLGYKKSKIFTVTVAAPAYKGYEEHTLKATVTGTLVKTTMTQNVTVTSKSPFILKNFISLIIHEVDEEEANANLEEAAGLVEEMQQAGFPVKKSLKLLEEAEEKLDIGRYQLAKGIADQISKIRDNAFSADTLIQEVKSKIQESEDKGLQVEETKRMINLAVAAFEREDFLAALQRAKDAQLSLVIETKGKVNILKFLINYWLPLLVMLIVLLTGSYFTRKQLALVLISRRLEDLQKEEVTINELIRETQQKYYTRKNISTTEYHKIMYGYEKRLSEISQLIPRLRSKRVGIIKISNEIKNLKKEDQDVVELIKKLQDNYYNKRAITRKAYLRRTEEYKLRRAEIEESIAVLEAKLAKKEKLEELKAEEAPGEKTKEIKKGQDIFRKLPQILSGAQRIFDVYKSRVFIAKTAKKLSFKNLFKREEGKDHVEHVRGLVDDLVEKKDDKSVLSKKPITTKPESIKKIRARLPSIKSMPIKKLFQKAEEAIKKSSLKDPILKLKERIRKKPFHKSAHKKKEIISKLTDKFRLDMSEISKISEHAQMSKKRGFFEHTRKSKISDELKVFDKIKTKRVKDYTTDRDVLEEHGFKVKPMAFSKADATKHNILKHLKEVHSK